MNSSRRFLVFAFAVLAFCAARCPAGLAAQGVRPAASAHRDRLAESAGRGRQRHRRTRAVGHEPTERRRAIAGAIRFRYAPRRTVHDSGRVRWWRRRGVRAEDRREPQRESRCDHRRRRQRGSDYVTEAVEFTGQAIPSSHRVALVQPPPSCATSWPRCRRYPADWIDDAVDAAGEAARRLPDRTTDLTTSPSTVRISTIRSVSPARPVSARAWRRFPASRSSSAGQRGAHTMSPGNFVGAG